MRKFFLGILILVTFIMSAGLSGCTDPETARRVLEDNGYTNIQIGGYDGFACSEDDFSHTMFTAISPNGRQVHGVVCSSMGKGATIRFK